MNKALTKEMPFFKYSFATSVPYRTVTPTVIFPSYPLLKTGQKLIYFPDIYKSCVSGSGNLCPYL